ncbi:MAG: endonuclease/exonuclease/phosphatase family protein [Paludibacteraceae bacterium]|nr:endonuclease/exonuclease/phosphatase family protein [Paludibacteraceae bacterium]
MKRSLAIISVLFGALSLLAQVHIPAGDPQTWSAQQALSPYVGQTVIFDMPIVVCSNAKSDLVVSPWRMFDPDNQGVGGSKDYVTAMHINGSCGFTLTGVSGYHRCGEKIYNLRAKVNSTSRLTFESGDWRGNTRADMEAGLPDVGEYRLLICGFNLENYFVEHLGSDYLGANSQAAHDKQREKISKALKQINADIFGLVELEQGDAAIQEIVNDLNANIPGRNYQFFHDSYSGSNQKSDIVYDANKVEPIGTPAHIDTEVSDRKKMVGFREKATGERFIYSINHFKAMTGGGDTESRRLNEARAVVNYYNSYRANGNIRDNDILIMGDLNAHAKTAPVLFFTDNGLIDLHRAFHADSSYSYMYSGKASYIDHALCSSSLYSQITGMAGYHINSDENDAYTYDKSSDKTMFRSSDHDPVLVGLKLDSTLMYDPTPQLNSAEILSGEAEELIILNAHSDESKSYYAIYSVNGVLLERKEITSVYYEVQLPADPGVYVVYIYSDGQTFQRKMIVR